MPAGDYIDVWNELIQHWYKARWRAWALGGEFPAQSLIGDSGTISHVLDATHLKDASRTISGNPPVDTRWPVDRWHGNSVNGPNEWDLIIDLGGGNNDPRQIIHLTITGNTEDTLVVSGLEDWIVRGQINSVGDVALKLYWIICDTDDTGQWWSERLPEWPRARSRIRSVITTSTNESLSDATQGWSLNQWSGFDLICSGDDGKLHRVTIASNTPNALSFPTQTWSPTPGSEYHIIAHGGLWHEWPDCPIGAWYRNLMESAASRLPDGSIGGSLVPTMSVSVRKYDWTWGTVYSESTDCFDRDIWGEDTDTPPGALPGKSYTPGIYKSLRGLQVWVEEHSASFVEMRNYEAFAKQIRAMTVAEWAALAGLTCETTTLGNPVSGGIECPCDLKSPPAVDVWYAVIRDADNAVEHAGRAVWAEGILYGTGMDETDTAKAILIAAVWTRHLPREFRYFFDKTCFQPTNATGVQEPGYYRTRPRSTRNSEYDRLGYRADPFDPDHDGADAIADGQFARYIGDNSPDPTLATAIPGAEFWLDVFNTSRGLDPLPLTGSTNSGDAWHLIDTTQNWVGTRIEHVGIPTAVGTASLSDSAQAASPYWTQPELGRWIDHVVEILQEGEGAEHTNGPCHGAKRPISSHSGTTIGWDQAIAGLYDTFEYTYLDGEGDPQTATGQTKYRIREPAYELNRWRGRNVMITRPSDGQQWTVKIKYSDATMLWFESAVPVAIQPGWTYVIDEPVMGGTYRRESGQWVKASTDPTVDIRALPPDELTRHGRFMKGDYRGPWLYDQIDAGLEQMQWTLGSFGWVSRLDPLVAEYNDKLVQGPFGQIYYPSDGTAATFAEALSYVETTYIAPLWTGFSPGQQTEDGHWIESPTLPPHSLHVCNDDKFYDVTTGFVLEVAGGEVAQVESSFAYGRHDPNQPKLGYDLEMYAFCRVEGDNSEHQEQHDGENGPYAIRTVTSWIFDDRGTGMRDGAWHLFHTETVDDGQIQPVYSDRVGSIDQPQATELVEAENLSGQGYSQNQSYMREGFEVRQWLLFKKWIIPA